MKTKKKKKKRWTNSFFILLFSSFDSSCTRNTTCLSFTSAFFSFLPPLFFFFFFSSYPRLVCLKTDFNTRLTIYICTFPLHHCLSFCFLISTVIAHLSALLTTQLLLLLFGSAFLSYYLSSPLLLLRLQIQRCSVARLLLVRLPRSSLRRWWRWWLHASVKRKRRLMRMRMRRRMTIATSKYTHTKKMKTLLAWSNVACSLQTPMHKQMRIFFFL